jgi:hypothetical protein
MTQSERDPVKIVSPYSHRRPDALAQQNDSSYTRRLHQAFFEQPANDLPALANHPVDPRCPYGFNIYVYDLQGETTGQKFLEFIMKHRGPFCQDDCNDAQFAVEIHLWRYLLKSPCRVKDPEQAHLFYIPYLETLQWLSPIKPEGALDSMYHALVDHEYSGFEEVGRLDLLISNLTRRQMHGMTSKYLARHKGLDHVLTLATPPFSEHILTANVPILDFSLVTSIIPEITKELFDHKKAIGAENVILMPYPVFNAPWMPLRKTKAPLNRRYLASGLYGLHGDGERVRRLLIDAAATLKQDKRLVGRLLFGEYTPAELRTAAFKGQTGSQVMFDTTFCLTPAGDSLSTRRCASSCDAMFS